MKLESPTWQHTSPRKTHSARRIVLWSLSRTGGQKSKSKKRDLEGEKWEQVDVGRGGVDGMREEGRQGFWRDKPGNVAVSAEIAPLMCDPEARAIFSIKQRGYKRS